MSKSKPVFVLTGMLIQDDNSSCICDENEDEIICLTKRLASAGLVGKRIVVTVAELVESSPDKTDVKYHDPNYPDYW